jgi:hypothetical protein
MYGRLRFKRRFTRRRYRRRSGFRRRRWSTGVTRRFVKRYRRNRFAYRKRVFRRRFIKRRRFIRRRGSFIKKTVNFIRRYRNASASHVVGPTRYWPIFKNAVNSAAAAASPFAIAGASAAANRYLARTVGNAVFNRRFHPLNI